MKKAITVLMAMILLASSAFADVPDVSDLSLEELLQLQENVNESIADQYTYTLLPGIYDCKQDFRWKWYNCKVLPGPNGEVRTTTITFHKYTPDKNGFLEYVISSNDEGIKLSLVHDGSSAQLFMVVNGAPLEAVPYAGF